MPENHKIDQSLANRILEENLFTKHNIPILDKDIWFALRDGAKGHVGSLRYLKESDEIFQLFKAMNKINNTYTIKNLDAIQSYFKKSPQENDKLQILFSDFYEKTFIEMLYCLKEQIFQLQDMHDIKHFIYCIEERISELKEAGFPEDYDQLTFVLKVSLDIKDGSLVHQVLIGYTSEEMYTEEYDEEAHDDEEETEEDDEAEEDLVDSEESHYKQDIFDISNFISIWSKHTYDKDIALEIIKNISYGRTLFDVFGVNENKIKDIKK